MSINTPDEAPQDVAAVQSATGTIRLVPTSEPSPKGLLFITGLSIGQLGLFIALFAPIMIGMAIKVGQLTSDSAELTAIMGNAFGLGGIGAFLGNSIAGRLSDRTRSRFGMRRPYLVGGAVLMALAFFGLVIAPDGGTLALCWFIAQFAANAAYGPYAATMADQLPPHQYARVSAIVGIMQNIAIFLATWIATALSANLLAMFMVPALICVAAMLVYSFILPDKVLTERPEPFRLGVVLKTFWVNPVKFPDFALAWWSRFLVIMGYTMFISFRFPYVADHLGVAKNDVPGVVSQGILWYTLTLIASGFIAGWISDRIGRRKVFVCASSILFAIGTFLLLHISTVEQFYLVEAFIGIGFGIYVALDLALVLQVLPNPEERGKDLGVFNLANAGPGSFAPYLGGVLLGIGVVSGAKPNYELMLIAAAVMALIGAFFVLPIKKVR